MRNAVFTLLRDDQELANLGFEPQVYYASPALDTPEDLQFIVLRWSETTAEFGLIGTQELSVWVHCKSPDYKLINKTLERIKSLMTNTTHRVGSDGILTQARWTGDSADFRDDGFGTFTRNSGFRCNGGSGG